MRRRTHLLDQGDVCGRIVIAGWDAEGIVFVSTEGEIIVEYLWQPEGTAYVGIRKARARFRK